MPKNTDFTVDQLITIAPMSTTPFKVIAIDDLSDDMLFVERVGGGEAGKWVFTTFCAPAPKDREDATA
jgi:hypothetical protein